MIVVLILILDFSIFYNMNFQMSKKNLKMIIHWVLHTTAQDYEIRYIILIHVVHMCSLYGQHVDLKNMMIEISEVFIICYVLLLHFHF